MFFNIKYSSLDEFWPFYVSEHLNPVNRRLHFAGTTVALALAACGQLGAALLFGYGFAWIGHFAFEKNRPATFKHPLLSFRADFKMYFLIATGRMDGEILRLSSDLQRLRRG